MLKNCAKAVSSLWLACVSNWLKIGKLTFMCSKTASSSQFYPELFDFYPTTNLRFLNPLINIFSTLSTIPIKKTTKINLSNYNNY